MAAMTEAFEEDVRARLRKESRRRVFVEPFGIIQLLPYILIHLTLY